MKMATAIGNWLLTASSWEHAHSCITSPAEIFGETSNHPGDSAPPQPRFGALWLLGFPKTKITFGRGEISGHWWDSGIYNSWTVWGPKMPTLKGSEASLSYVQCFLYLVFSLINVSIFYITRLDTFWTNCVCACVHVHTHMYTHIHIYIYIQDSCKCNF